MAINKGSSTPKSGDEAMAAVDTPNSEARGLAHKPTQAPLLQHTNRIGAAEEMPPVILANIDFLVFIILF